MYMIWQVIATNGQQRPLATAAAVLVLHVEAVSTTAPISRANVAGPALRPTPTATSIHSAQFYTCRTEC